MTLTVRYARLIGDEHGYYDATNYDTFDSGTDDEDDAYSTFDDFARDQLGEDCIDVTDGGYEHEPDGFIGWGRVFAVTTYDPATKQEYISLYTVEIEETA